MSDIAPHLFLLLALAAFVAGFVDAIAGGGGLITVPALLIAGVPPVQALGTNKIQGVFGTASATIAYSRRGHVDLSTQLPIALMATTGSAIGAGLTTFVPSDYLRALMPALLVAIALYFALKPDLDDLDRHRRMGTLLFGLTVVPLIGFYDGIFGPGTGSFFMLAFITLGGFGVLKATAHTKLLNLGSNFGALAVFILTGSILWKVGLIMGACQFLGAQLGSRLAMRIGGRLIRPLLVVICVAFAVKLLADPTNPLWLWISQNGSSV